MAADDPTTIWARLSAGDGPGALRREAVRARRRVTARAAPWRATSSLLPAQRPCPPLPPLAVALDALLAALPRHAKRQLCATCRGGRAALNSRVTAIKMPLRLSAAGLPAAVARMPRLRSLDCTLGFKEVEAECAELAGALAAAPASLAAFKFSQFPFGEEAYDDGAAPPRAIADALAAHTGLTDLDLQLGPSPAQCAAFVAAVGRLTRLRALRVYTCFPPEVVDPWSEAPPTLALPSTLQARAVRLLMPRG
jgi:hypothetical protein